MAPSTMLPTDDDMIVTLTARQLRQLVRLAVGEALDEHQQPLLVGRRDLARRLGVCPDTVDKLRGEGLPELTLSKTPRFHVGEVMVWLRDRGHQRTPPKTEPDSEAENGSKATGPGLETARPAHKRAGPG